jgi:hypothetical protein
MDTNHTHNSVQTAIMYRMSLRYSRLWKPQPLIQGLQHFKHMLYHEKLSDMEVKVLFKTELFQQNEKNCST